MEGYASPFVLQSHMIGAELHGAERRFVKRH